MKWIVTLLIFSQTIYSQVDELKNLPKIYDEFANTTFYSPYPEGQWYNTLMYPTITGTTFMIYDLIITLQYVGDDWIFFDEIYFIYDNGRFTLPFKRPHQDVLGNGNVIEKADVSIKNDMKFRLALHEIVKSKSVKLRFAGKYTYDHTLSAGEIATLKLYYDIFNKYIPIEYKVKNPEPSEKELTEATAKKNKENNFAIVFMVLIIGSIVGYAMYNNFKNQRIQKDYYDRRAQQMAQQKEQDQDS